MVPVGVEAEEYVAFIPDWAMPLSIGTVKVMNEGLQGIGLLQDLKAR